MKYSLEPKYKKYVQGYGFLPFERKFGDKYGKKLMETATKTGRDAAKSASKRVVKKTAKATEDLSVNKIADKITSVGKSKKREKMMNQMKWKKFTFHQKRDNKLMMTYDCFKLHITMEYQKITNLLGNIPDKVPTVFFIIF